MSNLMVATTPHFILFAESRSGGAAGRWRFVLASTAGRGRLSAGDFEPGVRGERLALLSVVRGLEALDQPSRVTVVTPSRYVRQGLQRGLAEWRERDWCWERFGELVPVKHLDLWRRVDQALKFHQVECRKWRPDAPDATGDSSSRAVKWRFDAPHDTGGQATQATDEDGAGEARAAAQARRGRSRSNAGWTRRLGQRLSPLGHRLSEHAYCVEAGG
jgi:ribonuclease HI